MRPNLKIISVRLEPHTIQLIKKLQADLSQMIINNSPSPSNRSYNRSEIIRYAITAGLDVLLSQQSLKPNKN